MTKKKDSITIFVPNDTDIKSIRQEFNESELSKEYKLNIIISGCADPILNLGAFLSSWIKK